MNRFDEAHARPGGYGLVVLALTIALAFVGACSTPTDNNDESVEDQVIGKPPAADEDPFFVQRMPGEAVEAAPSGSIGDDEEETEEDAPEEQSAQDNADEKKADDEVASRAPDRDKPDRDKQDTSRPERPQTPQQPQCFSCVRICPTDGDCDQAKDDVICGWGVHETAAEAKRLAKAECDATLDMARQMPVWSEIAGDCPTATCR